VSKSGFSFDPENVATITGTSEAFYGWVAANALRQTFDATAPVPAGSLGVGSLDLGGASTQIAVAVDPSLSSPGLVSATFSGKTYVIYAASFLGCVARGRRPVAKQAQAGFSQPRRHSGGAHVGTWVNSGGEGGEGGGAASRRCNLAPFALG
jgi:hypothetical protein